MSPATIRLVHPGDLDAVATTLGRAFADDPVWSYLLPDLDDDERAHRMRPFFRREARHRTKLATVWTTPGNEAAAVWAPPGQWRTSVGDGLGLVWALVRAGGAKVVARLPALSTIERAHPRRAHWYLESLGTHPDHRGEGHATSLVQPVLDRCDTEGRPAYLESSKPSNVPYYERFGFAVTGEIVLPRGGPTVYSMWREPS